MMAPELRRQFQKHESGLDRELRRDKPRLFEALEDFANIRPNEEAWSHFRKRWPNFFPGDEYDKVAKGLRPSIVDYPYCLDLLWMGTDSPLEMLLGVDTRSYRADELQPEEMWIAGLASIPSDFEMDWEEGVFRYRGACDFQKALYLLFLQSWRARVCEKCKAKFIARRVAQKYCSTDCSESMQRELKQRWWAKHGETWRKERRASQPKGKG
jgi:hypothetical protein